MLLDSLFNPKSIAVVGVSTDPKKLGSVVLSNLLASGYKGEIYGVNPKYSEVLGVKCYSSLVDIPGEVELICVVVPSEFVKNVVEDGAKKGIKAAIIITAGFSETGEEGKVIEDEILKIAKENNIRILGPNCLGEIVSENNINLSFAMSNSVEGDVAFLSQSGAFLTAGLDLSLERNLGFSHMISIGNKSDLNENDFLHEWLENDKVKVIGAYLEDIKSGHELVQIYEKSETQKPFVVFKPGQTEESSKAISSHTGSLAGSYESFKTSMEQSGAIIVSDINEMFNNFMTFSWSKLPNGNRVGIVTNAGGPGVISTDFLIKNNLVLAQITAQTQDSIKDKLPSNASLNNPIDVIGDANAERYRVAIEALDKDENVDSILVILTPQIVTEIEETAKVVINAVKISNKPIIPIFLGGKYISLGMQKFYDNKIACFKDISEAIESLSAMVKYSNFLKNKATLQKDQSSILSQFLNKGKYRSELSNYLSDELKALPEDLVTKLSTEVEIELPKQAIVSTIDEAKEFAKDIYPVVLKATTETIAHKTEKKALYLNIDTPEKLERSFTELVSMIKDDFGINNPPLLIQEQIIANEEIFIGANRDGGVNVYSEESDGFGHLLAFGKGGIYTEVYKDIAYSASPSTTLETEQALQTTKIYQVINGARGKEKLAEDKLIELIQKVQSLVLMYPEIKSLDINPVLLTTSRAIAVDLKIFVQK